MTISTVIPFCMPYEQRWTRDQVDECARLFELDSDQIGQLLELKERLSDSPHYWGNGPFELVRFVLEHTCHGNVDTMEKRFRHCVEWRAENGLDTILETYSPPMLVYRFPAAIMRGTDLAGDVLVVIRQGDPLGLLHRYGKDELIQSIFWGNEFTIRGPWQRCLAGRPKQATAVIDLKGLNRRHYHPSLILLVQKVGFALQLHYPYIVKKVLVVNAPAIFRLVWTIFKPFILPHLRALMEVATEAQTEQLLSEHVDLRNLPEIIVPGIGQGKPVRGLNPNWDIDMTPPPGPTDWQRPPLVYGSNAESSYYYYKEQDTCPSYATVSLHISSLASSDNQSGEKGSRPPVTVRVMLLLKGMWLEKTDTTAVQINTIREAITIG